MGWTAGGRILFQVVFWVVTPCNAVVGYQHFVGPFCLHLHGVTTQKTSSWNIISVKASKLASGIHFLCHHTRTDSQVHAALTQWVPGAVSPRVNRPGRLSGYSSPSSAVIPQLPLTYSWRGVSLSKGTMLPSFLKNQRAKCGVTVAIYGGTTAPLSVLPPSSVDGSVWNLIRGSH
jgi:hypothetical protein